ncbi:MAG: magnesium transporter [Burkholderiaceae bacterium]
MTALLAASVIGRFEATLEQLVALAVLMPIVASMGGIAGSQTLTLVIRGLALGQIQKGNVRLLFTRELGISAINGVLWAVVIGLLVLAWLTMPCWGIIGVAILVNLLCAAAAGLTIPCCCTSLGIDPALAGSVILTTVTDVIGFAFLGLATIWLRWCQAQCNVYRQKKATRRSHFFCIVAEQAGFEPAVGY